MRTVRELLKECEKEIAKGNGDKIILISDDDEGNGFHYLDYDFTPDAHIVKDYGYDPEKEILLG